MQTAREKITTVFGKQNDFRLTEGRAAKTLTDRLFSQLQFELPILMKIMKEDKPDARLDHYPNCHSATAHLKALLTINMKRLSSYTTHFASSEIKFLHSAEKEFKALQQSLLSSSSPGLARQISERSLPSSSSPGLARQISNRLGITKEARVWFTSEGSSLSVCNENTPLLEAEF